MAEALRFTGCWPPLEVLEEFPNWVLDGDDEYTLRPEDQQASITDATDYTVAAATLADGSTAPAILSLAGGKVDAIDIYVRQDWWGLVRDYHHKTWRPLVQYWLPESERRPVARLDDSQVFPAHIVSRLPVEDGKLLQLAVSAATPPRRWKRWRMSGVFSVLTL